MKWTAAFLWTLLVLAAPAQDLPKCKQPLPARAEICRMGWSRFQSWCMENVEGGEAGIDAMARHYRDLRDEVGGQESRLSPPQAQQLEMTEKVVTQWLYARSRAGGAYKGGSLYAHLGPRLTAELADVKFECISDWGSSADGTSQWPLSYQSMAREPLKPLLGNGGELKAALKDEEAALQEACKQVRKLPGSARHKMQKFLLQVAERLDPNSRT
jgi:hypothetical protein